MTLARSTIQHAFALLGGFALTALWPAHAPAQVARGQAAPHHEPSSEANAPPNDLVKVVRESTRRFRDASVAEAEGYGLLFGCVSGPDWGAMGLHYVNLPLVIDGELDAARPEIVIYEPTPDGRVRLTGADYLVFADAWHANHPETPQLMGQLMHLFESPNRFGLPAFYTLHVWAWKDNPNGTFVNWHPLRRLPQPGAVNRCASGGQRPGERQTTTCNPVTASLLTTSGTCVPSSSRNSTVVPFLVSVRTEPAMVPDMAPPDTSPNVLIAPDTARLCCSSPSVRYDGRDPFTAAACPRLLEHAEFAPYDALDRLLKTLDP